MKMLYSEKFGENVIYICEYGYSHVVGHSINGIVQREKMFDPTAYNDDTLSPAMACYDKTCEVMSQQTGIPRPMPEAPNFVKAIQL